MQYIIKSMMQSNFWRNMARNLWYVQCVGCVGFLRFWYLYLSAYRSWLICFMLFVYLFKRSNNQTAPMHVKNARQVPEYEINPQELDFTNSVDITKVRYMFSFWSPKENLNIHVLSIWLLLAFSHGSAYFEFLFPLVWNPVVVVVCSFIKCVCAIL